MRILQKSLMSVALLCLLLILTSANQHLATSAHPITSLIKIRLKDRDLLTRLNAPGTEYTIYPNGKIKHLSFHVVSTHYEIEFYEEFNRGHEQVKLIKRYQIFDNHKLLHGWTRSFSNEGQLITESEWARGKQHGKQIIYNQETGLPNSEQEFMWGYPVNTWSLYYPNGNKASEITFPENDEVWLKSSLKGSDRGARSLATIDYPQPFTIEETWYYPSGEKQKEKSYSCYREKDHFVMQESGISTVYDKKGQVAIERNVPQGTGTVVEHYYSNGVERSVTSHWISDTHFKVVQESRLGTR